LVHIVDVQTVYNNEEKLKFKQSPIKDWSNAMYDFSTIIATVFFLDRREQFCSGIDYFMGSRDQNYAKS
jgi:hypothetical protein